MTLLAQDWFQSTHYHSESRDEDVEIQYMPVPHALHALNKIRYDYGLEALKTPLARALALRVAQAGDIEEVPGSQDRRHGRVLLLVDALTRTFKGLYRRYPLVESR
jgi:hypothetical protein